MASLSAHSSILINNPIAITEMIICLIRDVSPLRKGNIINPKSIDNVIAANGITMIAALEAPF